MRINEFNHAKGIVRQVTFVYVSFRDCCHRCLMVTFILSPLFKKDLFVSILNPLAFLPACMSM